MKYGVGTKTAVKIFNIMTNKYIGLISEKNRKFSYQVASCYTFIISECFLSCYDYRVGLTTPRGENIN